MNKLIVFCLLIYMPALSCQQNKTAKMLSVKEFAELIVDKNVQILDVRTPEEYSENHIPGAININVNGDDFLAKADSLLSKEKKVALYCRSGNRSKKATAILSEHGFEIYELEKGFNAWVEDGMDAIVKD